jgi:dihydrofolate reductase
MAASAKSTFTQPDGGDGTMELTVTTFVTMDGVMQGPGGAQEDTSNGFDQGGWMVPFIDQDFGEIVDAWFAHADAFLLGRRTYERMFPYWSQVTDPDEVVAQKLNNLPKHVVSRTLRSPQWAHSSVIDGDVVEAVKALKDEPGGELQVHGSARLVQTLNRHNLVDEYRLLVFPVVLGSGKRLFGDGTVPTAFKTVQNRTTSTGVVALTLRPTGTPPKGEVHPDA